LISLKPGWSIGRPGFFITCMELTV
jgi:hypothetical protein